jgi:hypothetical protein
VSVTPMLPCLVVVTEVEPLFCREEDARKMFGNVARETLWKWRKAGHIEAVRYGAAVLYSIESLKSFAAKLRAEGGLDRIA